MPVTDRKKNRYYPAWNIEGQAKPGIFNLAYDAFEVVAPDDLAWLLVTFGSATNQVRFLKLEELCGFTLQGRGKKAHCVLKPLNSLHTFPLFSF
jgi:hypothetical protein